MAITTAAATHSKSGPAAYRWTVDRMYRAIEAGVFDHPERIELIHGQLIDGERQSPSHAYVTDRLTRKLRASVMGKLQVREEKPLHIGVDSEPTPDIIVFNGAERDYEERHPSPTDVALVVEVADVSEDFDTQVKELLYAAAGVPEYWTVSLPSRQVIVHRLPSMDGYRSSFRVSGNETISLERAPEIGLVVGDLFA